MLLEQQWLYLALAGGFLLAALVLWAMHNRRQITVGIDVGNSHIKIVELHNGKRPVLRRYAILPTPPGTVQNGMVQDAALLAQALQQILKENKFYRKQVATALTGQNLLIRTVELPAMPKHEIQEAVKWQFDQFFQMRPEDTVSDYQVIEGEPGKPLSVMLVAMQKEPVLTMVNALHAAGLKTTLVDIEPLAVLRALSLSCNEPSATGTVAVLDYGAGTTNVSVFKNGILRAARVMHFGGNNFTNLLMEHYGWSFEQAELMKVRHGLRLDSPIAEVMIPARDQLFAEISRTLNFYFAEHRDETLETVYMLGGGSLIAGLKPQLENYLNEFINAIAPSFAVLLCNPLENQRILLPSSPMPVALPKAPAEEPEDKSDFVPRSRARVQQQVQKNEADATAIGVTLSIALGLALGGGSRNAR